MIQIFVPIAELAIPAVIATIEANVEIETHALTAEIKTRKYSSISKVWTLFHAFHSSNHYVLFNLFHLFFSLKSTLVIFVFNVVM